MPPFGHRPPFTVVVTRTGMRMDHAAQTPAAVLTVIARLAPHVPHDATWTIEPA